MKRINIITNNKKVANLKMVCVLFVLLAVVLSMLLLRSSVRADEETAERKREELSGVFSSMNTIADLLEDGALGRVRTESIFIRESGMLGSVSSSNRRKIYSFLRAISTEELSDEVKASAYARACAVCARKELYGEEVFLDDWIKETKEDTSIDPQNAISIAKSHSENGQHPNLYYHGRKVCAYGSNYYTLLEYSDKSERVWLDTHISDEWACNIQYLKEKICDLIDDEALKRSDPVFIFSDLGVAFFSVAADERQATAGISCDGSRLYLYRAEN